LEFIERPSRACLPAGRGSNPVFRSNRIEIVDVTVLFRIY